MMKMAPMMSDYYYHNEDRQQRYSPPVISAPRIIREENMITERRSSSLAPPFSYSSSSLQQQQQQHHHHRRPHHYQQQQQQPYSYVKPSPSSSLITSPRYSLSSSLSPSLPANTSTYLYSGSPSLAQYSSPYVGLTSSSNISTHIPKSRTSINYKIADVSKDGGLVTRRLSQSSSSGFQSSHAGYPGLSSRGRSMSIEPTSAFGGYRGSIVHSMEPSVRNRSSIITSSPTTSHHFSPSSSSYYQHQSRPPSRVGSIAYYTALPPATTSPQLSSYNDGLSYQPQQRFARRDSFSKPYYTVDDEHKSGDLVVKRTSVYQPLTSCNLPLTYLRRDSVYQHQQEEPHRVQQLRESSAAPDGRVVAASNVVSRRTSIGREPSVEASLASRRASLRRSLTPASPQQTTQQQLQQAQQRQRTSYYQNVVQPAGSDGRCPSVVAVRTSVSGGSGSRPGSFVVNNRDSTVGSVINRSSIVANDGLEFVRDNSANVGKTFYDYRGRREPMVVKSVANGPTVLLENNAFEMKQTAKQTPNGDDRFSLVQQLGSLADLKKRTSEVRNVMGRHRMLIDRYLPIKMGPEPEVAFEIQNKYGELVERMPHIERGGKYRAQYSDAEDDDIQQEGEHSRREGNDDENKARNKVKPYKPASNVKSYGSCLVNVHIPNSFTPVVSDTRKRARNVLCKVKGDPGYFNFN